MLLINNQEIFDREEVDSLLRIIKEDALTEEEKEFYAVVEEYLIEVFEQNLKLQEMVSEKISEDLISVVILPLDKNGNLDEFNFGLINVEGDKVYKRDELVFQNLCNICFGHVPGLVTRAIVNFAEP